MQGIDFLFGIAILIISVVIHEISHGYAANFLGDPTAKYAGRLTLNPLKHLDPFGSFLVPAMTFFIGGVIFGWAKPVPYNPYNLRNQKWGPALVGAAGPLSNFLVAIVFGLMIRSSGFLGLASPSFLQIASAIVFINILLGFFNSIPIPPLDGSKILFAFLPHKLSRIQEILESFGFFILLIFIFFFFQYLSPVINFLFRLITGV